MDNPPAWKIRDDTISDAFKNFIEEREAAWRIYFETIEAEKKTKKKAP
jgi:hypothetical protein